MAVVHKTEIAFARLEPLVHEVLVAACRALRRKKSPCVREAIEQWLRRLEADESSPLTPGERQAIRAALEGPSGARPGQNESA